MVGTPGLLTSRFSPPVSPKFNLGLANALASNLNAPLFSLGSASAMREIEALMRLLGQVLTTEPANSTPPASVVSQASKQTQANTANPGSDRVVIAQIDDFSTDKSGFNHGQEIAKVLRSGGEDKSLNGKVDLAQYNVAGGGNRADKIANAMEDIAKRVQNGEKIDAVNLSQQDSKSSGGSQRVKSAIEKLTALGVPVAVAAGNMGAQTSNQLASGSSFTVESTTGGRTNQSSGRGNMHSEARTTSFATANIAPQLAKRKAAGMSVEDIKAEAQSSGGALKKDSPAAGQASQGSAQGTVGGSATKAMAKNLSKTTFENAVNGLGTSESQEISPQTGVQKKKPEKRRVLFDEFSDTVRSTIRSRYPNISSADLANGVRKVLAANGINEDSAGLENNVPFLSMPANLFPERSPVSTKLAITA